MDLPKDNIIIEVAGMTSGLQLRDLEGKTFQIHVRQNNFIELYLIEIEPFIRCPVSINYEQCGLKFGHEGKHVWLNGD